MSYDPQIKLRLSKPAPKPLPKPEKKPKDFQGRTYKFVTMSKQDEESMKTQLKNIYQNDLALGKAEKKLAEITNNLVKSIVAQSILGTSINNFSDFAKDKMGLFVFENNNLILSEVAMKEVIIPFIKQYSIKEIFLATVLNKNDILVEIKIQGEALKILLKAIPETKITKLTLAESRVLALTNDESKLVVNLSNNHNIEFEQI